VRDQINRSLEDGKFCAPFEKVVSQRVLRSVRR
jgi:hypothetical protein